MFYIFIPDEQNILRSYYNDHTYARSLNEDHDVSQLI